MKAISDEIITVDGNKVVKVNFSPNQELPKYYEVFYTGDERYGISIN